MTHPQLKTDIEKFLEKNSGNPESRHMLRTAFWLREIYQEVDDVFYIAALCHDIERLFPLRDREVKPEKSLDDAKNQEYLAWHGKRSSEFAEKLLREYGLSDEEDMKRIKYLISNHSFPGEPEIDLLMDADSLSFFENIVDDFLEKYKDKKALMEKFDSEFARIKNEKARELARPFYESAVEKLGNL